MAKLEDILDDIKSYGRFSFSRSGGPGGQNVNKVNTNVLLAMPVTDFRSLDSNEHDVLRQKLENRINTNDELFIRVQQERSQLKNRIIAEERMARIVFQSIQREKTRKKTGPSAAARQRRIDEKKRRSEIKKSRRFSGLE